MTLDPDRRAALLAATLVAHVRRSWPDVPAELDSAAFPDGALVHDPAAGRLWVLLGADGAARLGAALAVAARRGAAEVHLLAPDDAVAGALARRAGCFGVVPTVWRIDGTELRRATPVPAVDLAPAPEAELYRPVLEAAGLEVLVEGGVVLGELRGLEVARVVVDDDGAHVEAGVGRFDREVGAMMFRELGEVDALARTVDLVDGIRRAAVDRHPLNTLVPERWLRAALVRRPDAVGAAWLRSVGSAVPRANLRDTGIATAVGADVDGRPLVVTCSTGVDLELVPGAADDRLLHAADARLVLAVPARDAIDVTTLLASHLASPAEVVAVPDGWRAWAEEA